ncbi:MAG: hypothetical protein IJK77_08020 [Lachnospiraceae bacterium]|nr:hypothetical protein [Lachnospiraceae bacterium]
MIGIILNVLNALLITAAVLWACRRVKKKNEPLGALFRYFTVLSNVLCAAASAAAAVSAAAGGISFGVSVFKYVGTCAVTVTLLTVLVFLAPALGSLKPLLEKQDLFLHLICPLVAIASYCLFDRAAMPFSFTLLGVAPVFCYGLFYLYKVVYAPEDKRWDDFYTFNRDGKWPVSFAAMLIGGFLISIALRAAGSI